MLIPLFHYFRFEAEAFYRAHFERYASLARNSLLSSHYAAAAASSNPAAALSALVLSMSFYPDFIMIISKLYPDCIQIFCFGKFKNRIYSAFLITIMCFFVKVKRFDDLVIILWKMVFSQSHVLHIPFSLIFKLSQGTVRQKVFDVSKWGKNWLFRMILFTF